MAPTSATTGPTHEHGPSVATAHAGRRDGRLDVLRCVAVLFVLVSHVWLPPETVTPTWRAVLFALQPCGGIGVDLFFVLSGFLIAGLLFKEHQRTGTFSIARFYLRRGWKIYPPFVVLILGTAWVAHVVRGEAVPLPLMVHELLFVQNYFEGMWGHTWSLAVEEHFYLLLPWVLYWLVQKPAAMRRRLLLLMVVIMLGTLTLRITNAILRPSFDFRTFVMPTHLRLDGLFWGVFLGYLHHYQQPWVQRVVQPWHRWLLAGGSVLLLLPLVWPVEQHFFMATVGLTLTALGSGLLLLGAQHRPAPTGRLSLLVARLGTYSYAIYLWHLTVRTWGVPWLEDAWDEPFPYAVRCVVFVGLSCVVGILMAELVERPAVFLRDRWFPSHTTPATATVPKPVVSPVT